MDIYPIQDIYTVSSYCSAAIVENYKSIIEKNIGLK
jgi:hypothetical protein